MGPRLHAPLALLSSSFSSSTVDLRRRHPTLWGELSPSSLLSLPRTPDLSPSSPPPLSTSPPTLVPRQTLPPPLLQPSRLARIDPNAA